MTFIPCPECAEVRLKGELNGEEVVNVFHVAGSNDMSLGELDDIALIFQDWINNDYIQVLSEDCSITEVTVRDLNTQNSLEIVKLLSPAQVGLVEFPVKTNQDTLAVSLRSGLAGRAYRGRFYVMALPESVYSDSNNITLIAQGVYATIGTALINKCNVGGHRLVVLSRQLNNVPRTEGVSVNVISSVVVDRHIDSMRSRLPGRGR